jgi:hypothetical protein
MLTASDKAQKESDRIARAREQREDDLKRVMENPWGRRVLAGLIFDVCMLERVSMPPADLPRADLLLSFNDGRRSIGADLKADLQHVTPGAYAQLVGEHLEAENLEAATKRAMAVPRAGER